MISMPCNWRNPQTTPNRTIRRYRQYHRLIVLPRLVCCDAFVASANWMFAGKGPENPWSVDSLVSSNVESVRSGSLYSATQKGSRALKLLKGSVCLFLRSRRAYSMRAVIFDSASNENTNSAVQWVFDRNSS